MSALFQPTKLGLFALDHRVVMAPLTRLRAGAGDVPTPLMAEYYAQRASKGGLIIVEATTVSPDGRAYQGAPGIYDDSHVEGWRRVTDAVHAKGGWIFLQLWHTGRVGHVDITGKQPVGPSVVPFEGMAHTPTGWQPVSPHRALEIDELPGIVSAYRDAAERANAAVFDGVEIHAANGYLLDQFLNDGSNKRTDAYGGSIENRTRLLLDVTEAVTSIWGVGRVGVRLSPSGSFLGMQDSDPEALYGYVAEALNRFDLAYLHIVEPRVAGGTTLEEGKAAVASSQLRRRFHGRIIAAGGFDADGASNIVAEGHADAVAFGRHFIANPDLPLRLKDNLALNPHDRDTFYGGDHKGYTDYPFYAEALAAA